MRLDVEVTSEMTTSCCMCEPVRTAQPLGDNTHAVAIGLHWALEHGLHSAVWSLCVGGLKGWLIDGCSNKDAGKVELETPTPLW